MEYDSNVFKEKNEKEIERIVEVLQFFSVRQTTFMDWLNVTNGHQKLADEEFFFNSLFFAGFLRFPMEGNDKYLCLFNEHSNKLIYLTKEGYSFLDSHKFNKQSLEINQKALVISEQALKISDYVRNISIAAVVIAEISLIVTILNIFHC